MNREEVELIRRLNFGSVTEPELIDIYHENKSNYRILLNLVQHPRFPIKFSLNFVPSLFSMDLLRVIKNRRTNPFIRKKVEFEFAARYNKFPMGEKLSYLKIAPSSLLNHFIKENDRRVLKTILNNTSCTEELVIKFVTRKSPKFVFYEVLSSTDWYKRPAIANLIAGDSDAPIKLVLKIIPYLNIHQLKKIHEKEDTHEIIKKNVAEYLRNKNDSN